MGGLNFNAMPPFKRFRQMKALSGGERSLATLALLFAIHSYQPAPFFVLDEVDASLDPINLQRLVRFLRDHASKHFQCIIISHKEATYSHADRLIGVCKDQSSDASRVLSVDLTRYPEEA